MKTYHQIQHRKGVTLLVVLALMTMFAMLTITFMIITAQAKRAAEHLAGSIINGGGSGDGGHSILTSDFNTAIEKLLIGDKLESVLGPHSILENLYGHPNTSTTLILEANSATASTHGTGLIQITGTLSGTLYDIDNLRGSVITFIKDEESRTTRIVNEQESLIAPFDRKTDTETVAFINGCNKVFVNTPEFSGTGIGFDNTIITADAPLLVAEDADNMPWVLRPNILANNGGDYKTYLNDNQVLANPDYTAPDYQTMFLAWNNIDSTTGKIINTIPSFHRPQLVKYWIGEGKSTDNHIRKYTLRPMPQDHPNFTGSNPAATASNYLSFLQNGPWDVDNDGDGIADGIWLDAGLGIFIDPKTPGTTYKKLVSYYVLDMDGRINLNVHGNKFPPTASIISGTGFGPAEIEVDSTLVPNLVKADSTNPADKNKNGRYGSDGEPGSSADETTAANIMIEKTGLNPQWYAHPANTAAHGGTLPDLFGNIELKFDEFGNRKFPSYNNIYENNPYLFNPYSEPGEDMPFTAGEFEKILRSFGDTDFDTMSSRMWKFIENGTADNKFSQYRLTTTPISSSIPVAVRRINSQNNRLYEYIKTEIGAANPDKLWALLPEEIRHGEKVNLNRLSLSDKSGDALTAEKAKFAQEIFYLLAVLCHKQIEIDGYTEKFTGTDKKGDVYTRLAQWAVNLVDFIDPDAIMTPFVFSTAPFAEATPYDCVPFDASGNFDTDGDIMKILNNAWTIPAGKKLIWGMERPEIAMTKTLAVHNRRVADSRKLGPKGADEKDTAGSRCGDYYNRIGSDSGHDDSLDQVAEPESSLFIELYRQGDNQRQGYDGYLVDSSNMLNLAKKTGTAGTDDFVWRIAVSEQGKDVFNELKSSGKAEKYTFQPPQKDDISTSIGNESLVGTDCKDMKLDRFIYFGTGADKAADTAISFYNTDNTAATVQLKSNDYLIVASREKTSFQSKEVNDETVITDTAKYATDFNKELGTADTYLDLAGITDVNVKTMLAGTGGANNVDLNVTLPKDYTTVAPRDTPYTDADTEIGEAANPNWYGTKVNYKSVFLQRLADPTRDYNKITNPYITVDWNTIDLNVINSEKDSNSKGTTDPTGDFKFAIRQWGYTNKSSINDNPNIWDRSFDTDKIDSMTVTNNPLDIKFDTESKDGGTLVFGRPANGITLTDGAAATSYIHFPWNDSPFANTMELMLVPACSASRFGFEFHDNSGDWFAAADKENSLGAGLRYRYKADSTAGDYGPYLNFYAKKDTATATGNSLDLSRLFDYVRVPSRFAGTIKWTKDGSNPLLYPYYTMREPGKVNINTLNEKTWNAMDGGRGYTDTDNRLPFNAVNNVTGTPPSEFKPFRSLAAKDLVPLESEQSSLPDLVPPNSAGENPYMNLEKTMRLSDLTTTRSNVFAVWITIGYFEATQDDSKTNIPQSSDGHRYVLGKEKGLDNGTVKRHRAFYFIDRSIPVGFRRGETFKKADGTPQYKDIILKETILE